MPARAKRPCRQFGCAAVVSSGYCAKHQPIADKKEAERRQRWAATKATRDKYRGTRTERGYSNHWLRLRADYLRSHPLCANCQAHGRFTSATVVDHIRPHRGDDVLMWDESNWQPLCASCHSRKTASEDGGFGNRPKGVGAVE